MVPESAICLCGGKNSQVAIGDGCDRLALLEGNNNALHLARSSRNGVPNEVEQVLQNLFENLGGQPSQRCAIDFVEWLYSARPAILVTVLEYFLANSDYWMIGLPDETASKRFFSEVPIHIDVDRIHRWYQLCELGLVCSIDRHVI